MVDTIRDAREDYTRRLDFNQLQLAQLNKRLAQLVWMRGTLFLGAASCLGIGFLEPTAPSWLTTIGWIIAGAFLVAIVAHEHFRLSEINLNSDAELFRHLLARLDRRWQDIPPESLLPEYQSLACADDLDVAGPASLLTLVNLAVSRPGRAALQAWIAHPPVWDEVLQRQQATKSLVGLRDLRLSIIKTTRASSDGSEDVYGLPEWAKTPNWLMTHRFAHTLSYLGPLLVIGGCIGLAVTAGSEKAVYVNIGAALLGGGFAVNIFLTIFWGSWLHEIFQQITGQHKAVYGFSNVFQSFRNLPTDSPILEEARSAAVEGEHCATTGFSRLLRYVRLANLQRDPTMYIVYLGLQLLFAWDFRVLERLEAWKARFGEHVTGWFDSLGNCEALISIATLADEEPEWAYPASPDSDDVLVNTTQLAHPLLPSNVRIANDLQLSKSKPLLLVTGSNMAGKSTFMRSLGLNMLLARTGGPVCATKFQSHHYELASSIRVRDSLRDGVSFFMAELRRLKEVVDQAEQHAADSQPPLFYLLDEILQGTNSRERQIAVASVLSKLNRFGAQGLLSTHDLDLASEPLVAEISQIVHFREHFVTVGDHEEMHFDYKMHPGPTPTTNALKLLRLVGLSDE